MKVIEDYEICYPKPLDLKVGDEIQLFEKDVPEKWIGWNWCRDQLGNEGWISESYFERQGTQARVRKNYTAKELAVRKKDEVQLLHTDCGWAWCQREDGEEGWLPIEILVDVTYAREDLIKSFYKVLDEVAKEEIYIEMIEAPDYEKVEKFQKNLISKNQPVYYAIVDGKVVGWADISSPPNPRLSHRGFLGMGVHKDYRGRGIGFSLLEKALNHSQEIGLEKVELSVYTVNKTAIRLYKKLGFREIGSSQSFGSCARNILTP